MSEEALAAPSRLERVLREHALAVAVVASLGVGLLPRGLWVDQLFLTFVHEACHGLAAVLTGGAFLSLAVHPDGSGVAYTRGGFRPLILVAGYAGACLWGGALLLAARHRGPERLICWGLAGFMLILTLGWTRDWFGLPAGLAFAAFFGWVAVRGAGWVVSWLLAFLAVRSILNSFHDLWVLLRLAGNGPLTDADLLSRELTLGLVPPVVFAVGIAACSVGVLWALARLALPPRGQEGT
ncbi:MAG: M50 family metallopeptidase [Candidatus Sericytochromatia bacterium]|nr:M50 family metallopeptidase [Candidatus Sericytochromatia bacterium]